MIDKNTEYSYHYTCTSCGKFFTRSYRASSEEDDYCKDCAIDNDNKIDRTLPPKILGWDSAGDDSHIKTEIGEVNLKGLIGINKEPEEPIKHSPKKENNDFGELQMSLGSVVERIKSCTQELQAIDLLQFNNYNSFDYFSSSVNILERRNYLTDIILLMTEDLEDRIQ